MVTLNLADGESAEISSKSAKKYQNGYFTRVGRSYQSQRGNAFMQSIPQNMDFFTTLKKIYKSTAAMWLLLELESNRDRMNLAVIKFALLTPTEQNKIKLGKKSLIQEGIIKVMSKEIYMLNPYLILPENSVIEVVREKWDALP